MAGETQKSGPPDLGSLTVGLPLFLRDFVVFAGRKGMIAAIFVALGALVEGIGLLLVIPLLAIVIGSGLTGGGLEAAVKAVFDRLGLELPLGQLALLLGLFGLLMTVRAVIISVRDSAVAELRVGFIDSWRMRIAESLAAAPWHKVVALNHARVTNVMTVDVQRIGAASHFVLQCTVAGVLLLVQCVLVLMLAPMFATVAFMALAIGAVAFMPVLKRARRLGADQTGANLALAASTAQFLGGLKLAMSQNMQTGFVDEFADTVRVQSRRQIDYVRQQTKMRLALAMLSAIAGGLLVLIGFGAFDIAPPTLIALLLIVARMSGPVGQLQQGTQQLAHSLPAYENVKQLAADLAGIGKVQPCPMQPQPLAEGPIEFDDVWFVHRGTDGAQRASGGVRGISVTIAPDEFVGVTGASGSGKTTFADLLVGLFEPQKGRITAGGQLLQGATLNAWRARVGYVPQDPFLFHDTVRRNLVWAKPRVTEPEMWDALALTGVADLVRRLPRGLDTVVGERGTLLSGGERQRIALARAILRVPRLLVLDEATSAIDIEGEREILERLRRVAPRRAIVLIAHRAESVALCDRVLRLDAGQIV